MKKITRVALVLSATAAMAFPATPAQASTCHIAQPDVHAVVCDTVWAPVARTLCKLKVCFG